MASTVSAPAPPAARLFKTVSLGIVLLIAAGFVVKYVFHYYLNYNPAGFYDLWPKRFTLLVHITSGMVALLTGPFQFSSRLRRRYLRWHRITGRVYLIAIVCGSLAALRLAVTTNGGWAWGFGLASLATAWFTTSAMAYYAVRKRHIAVHKEWMVRSYVVTFAFVTFRILNDYPPFVRLQPENDRANAAIWACWALPLLAVEVIQQVRRLRTAER